MKITLPTFPDGWWFVLVAFGVALCYAVAVTLFYRRKRRMDWTALMAKLDEAQTAVTDAFTRAGAALAGTPTPDQIAAAGAKVQAIIDAAGATLPTTTTTL